MIVWACLLVVAPALAQVSKSVDTTQGPVVGYTSEGSNVFAFYGIPYATAPTGRDKFKDPLPPPVWTEPLQATDGKIMCPHYNAVNNYPGGTIKEDCLVANVFVPNTNETNLPVLFMVHGGGFLTGYGNSDEPKQFLETKNFVFVSFNYRLGPHGFLCMGTEAIPGNAGIKDQVAALRWVNANIANFGGNPNDVTIAGCSAGGAAVDLLMISNMTQGLFNKVVGTSGANVANFAVQVDPIENAEYYAEKIGFAGGDLSALEEFYRTVSFDQLLSYSLESNKDHAVKMSPCLERDLGKEIFLDESPVNILRSGNYKKYPMLYGYTDMEGLLRIGNFEEWSKEMSEDFTNFVPADLEFKSAQEKEQVAQDIKRFYFGDNPVDNTTILSYINFFSDAMFVYPMQKAVKLQVESGNNEIYLHLYTFTDENTPYVPYTQEKGVFHCMHTFSIFDEDYSTLTPEYIEMKETMRQLWFDFIKTGKPTTQTLPNWPPTGTDRAPCMNIGRTIELQGTFAKNRTEFWDNIYGNYYRQPVAPSSSSVASINVLLGVSLLFLAPLVPALR